MTKLVSISILALLTDDRFGHYPCLMAEVSIIQILELWPSRQALADDCSVDLFAVHRWFQRGRVPARHDFSLLLAAKRRGFELNAYQLAEARAENRLLARAENLRAGRAS